MYFAETYEYSKWFADLGTGVIYPVFINCKLPFDATEFDLEKLAYSDIRDFALFEYGVLLPQIEVFTKMDEAGVKNPFWVYLRNDQPKGIISTLKGAGFDGIKLIENNPQQLINDKEAKTVAWAIFSSEQVKRMDATNFNPSIKPMIFNKGGEIKDLENFNPKVVDYNKYRF